MAVAVQGAEIMAVATGSGDNGGTGDTGSGDNGGAGGTGEREIMRSRRYRSGDNGDADRRYRRYRRAVQASG